MKRWQFSPQCLIVVFIIGLFLGLATGGGIGQYCGCQSEHAVMQAKVDSLQAIIDRWGLTEADTARAVSDSITPNAGR